MNNILSEGIKCPHCGSRSFLVENTVSTCIGWTATFVDGKRVELDPNTYTSTCVCVKCSKYFHIIEKEGTETKVIPE